MGTIQVDGRAEREVEADLMDITVSFSVNDCSTAEAVRKVKEQCENFLNDLKQIGVNMKGIRLKTDDISQEYDDETKEILVSADRTIIIKTQFDMIFNNKILELFQEKHYDVSYRTAFRLSGLEKIHQELMKEALLDSKRKAEMIAEIMNQKITGIDSVKPKKYHNYGTMDYMVMEQEHSLSMKAPSVTQLSDKIGGPTSIEDEEIEVIWKIE